MTSQRVAIIGMACRFPEARHPRLFWNNLREGRSSIREIPASRWDSALHYSADRGAPGKSISRWCGLVEGVEGFDHRFFNISPREAVSMDPQQRLLLEESWRCIEDAGVPPRRLREARTGVYVGVMASDYALELFEARAPVDGYATLGNYECILANRLSHVLGLRGPSLAIDAACASSLVALHEAGRSLLLGECDYALAAGVSLNLHPWKYISFSKAGMLSPDGRCKTFDMEANGYVPGDGIGVLLLQRLEDALREGNPVYGVVLGSAVNHVGHSQSITAPSAESQRDVILAAASGVAGVDLGSVTYVEAHGTGTSLGDPVEVEALTRAFSRHTERKRFCALGSVKTNIGHLEAAAGVAGVIKVLLMMRHRFIPQTLNVRTLNPIIDFEQSPFVVATEARPWQPREGVLRAGVSSFGFGGVNAHVLLEEPPRRPSPGRPEAPSPGGGLLLLSAHSSGAMEQLLRDWRSFAQGPDFEALELEQVCLTAQGRESFPFRLGARVGSKEEVRAFLADARPPPASGSRPFCLRLGSFDSFAAFGALAARCWPIQQSLERLSRSLEGCGVDPGTLTDGPAGRLLGAAALVQALGELGFVPQLVAGEGEGAWLALVVAGALPLEDAVAALQGHKAVAGLRPVRPRIALFDPVRGDVMRPRRFSAAYVEELLRSCLPVGEELLKGLLDKARLLIGRQFTFTRFLADWDAPLAPWGLTSASLLEQGGRGEGQGGPGRRLLLYVCVATALRRLDRKWSLSAKTPHAGAGPDELLELVTSGALPAEALVPLLLAPTPDLAAAARVLEERQGRLDPASTPPLLQRRHGNLDEMGELSSWLASVQQGALPPGLEGMDCLELGQVQAPLPQALRMPALEAGAFAELLRVFWLGGVDIEWGKSWPGGAFLRVPLPTAAFEPRPLWVPRSNAASGPAPTRDAAPPDGASPQPPQEGQPPPQRRAPGPAEGGGQHLRYRYSRADAWVRDHVIRGRTLVPGACFITSAMQAVARGPGSEANAWRDLLLARPVPIEEGKEESAELELVLDLARSGFILKCGGALVCQGRFGRSSAAPPAPLDLGRLAVAAPVELTGVYPLLSRRGYGYGPSLRLLASGYELEEAYVFGVAGTGAPGSAVLDAALLDAVFQVVLAAELVVRGGEGSEPDGLYVPFAVQGLVQHAPLAGPCFAVVPKAGLRLAGGELRADVFVHGPEGRCALVLEQVRLKQVTPDFPSRHSAAPASTSAVDAALFHRLEWVVRDAPGAAGGRALIFADAGGGARLLAAAQPDARVVEPAVLESELECRRVLRDAGEVGVVYFLAGLDAREPERAEALDPSVMGLFRLGKALAAAVLRGTVHLIVVTRGLQQIAAHEVPAFPAAAPLLGMAKALGQENRRLSVCCVDLEDPTPAEQWLLLARERGPAPLAEVAFRGSARYVRALQPLPADVSGPGLPLREGGNYLIVGGMGGIGQEVARWLARNCRAGLVLVGRSPLDDERRKVLGELEAAGGRALYVQADATREVELARALEHARAQVGPLNGLFHSGLVLADGLARQMDESGFRAACEAKVATSVLLHRLTREDPLDLLVFFSSVLALQGNAGQCNYVAGCAFQDAFSTWLRARAGRPALTINWGYWGETGIVADDRHAALLRAQGIEPLGTREGIAALQRALERGGDRLVVARLREERLATLAPPEALTPPDNTALARSLTGESFARGLSRGVELGLTQLESYGLQLLVRALRGLGVRLAPGARLDLPSLTAHLRCTPRHARLLQALVAILVRHGLLLPEGRSFIGSAQLGTLDTGEDATCAQRAALVVLAPERTAHVELLEACLARFGDMLSQAVAATEVLFPNSSMHLVERIYRGNAFSDYFNHLVVRFVEGRLQRSGADPERPFRVLELGAGTGGTTRPVLAALAPHASRVRFVFTDVSRAFVKHGRAHFSRDYPFASFTALDIENVPDEQVASLGRFDLIFATNVVHACRDVSGTLANVRRLLAPAGTLLLNELCATQDFLTLTFGWLDGWWLYQDTAIRLPDAPLLSPSGWRSSLSNMGLSDIVTLGDPLRKESEQKQILVAGDLPQAVPSTQVAAAATAPAVAGPGGGASTRGDLHRKLCALVAEALGVEVAEVVPSERFIDLGVDSILGVELVNAINASLGLDLGPTVIYDYSSVEELCAYLLAHHRPKQDALEPVAPEPVPVAAAPAPVVPTPAPVVLAPMPVAPAPVVPTPAPVVPAPPSAIPAEARAAVAPVARAAAPVGGDVAIIGISGRFPGARDLEAFWANLAAGVDSITEVPRERWDTNAFHDPALSRPNTTNSRYGGFIEDIDRFDPLFFNLSPREAELMDPQQRLFLEHGWQALEDAGYAGATIDGARAAVFVGARPSDYLLGLYRHGEDVSAQMFTGNDAAILSARLSYFLNLKGPSLAVDTACSSSLVAIHLACQHLRSGQVDLALAGGVFVMTTPQFHLMAARAHMLAPDGRCKTFDDSADGFVPAEGVGVVVLKPLARALEDGDHVYGVIKGIDINQDGRTNGITAPSAHSQEGLIRGVHRQAGIEPASISYVEAHGTGTKLGDPIEVEALSRAFGGAEARERGCALGSVKSNIGHAITAAGVAGVLKVLLALKHRQLPPSLHFRKENRHIRFAETPFYVNTGLRPWTVPGGHPRRATVSSFGFSGTNAHLVLEEAPAPAPRRGGPDRPGYLFVLSAQSPEALSRAVDRLAAFTERSADGLHPGDVAFTLVQGRRHLAVRAAFVAPDLRALAATLASFRARGEAPHAVGPAEGAAPIRTRALLRELSASLVRGIAQASAVADAEKLLALGELFALGLDVDLAALYPEGTYRRVSLPTYPFARERCWPSAPAEGTRPQSLPPFSAPPPGAFAPAASTAASLPERAVLFERTWREVPEPSTPSTVDAPGTLIVLVNEETASSARQLLAPLRSARVVLVADRASAMASRVDEVLAFNLHEEGLRLGEQLGARAGQLAGVIDLVDVYTSPPPRRESADPAQAVMGRIGFLQTLVRRSRPSSFVLLHLTRGLHPFGGVDALDMRGAVMAAVVAGLGAEHAGVHARTVDVDVGEVGPLQRVVQRELSDREPFGEALYRQGRRHVPGLKSLPAPAMRLPALRADRTYVITGGVRGLGLEVARHLADRGARRLVLTGLTPLPPRASWRALLDDALTAPELRGRLSALLALEARGVTLRFHSGPLVDRAALEALVADVRASLGPIAGVVHCAGLALFESPAFVSRPEESMRRVFEPKVAGLHALEEALAGEPLDFFVLFSSVSALVPALAVGLFDYAAANSYMNALASHRRAQGLPWHALSWPGWKEAGMRLAESAPYRALGFTNHTTAEGMALLDAATATGAAVVLPAIVDPDRFDAARLPRLDRPRPAPAAAPVPAASSGPASSAPTSSAPTSSAPVPLDPGDAASALQPKAERWLRALLARELKLAEHRIDLHADFAELGVDSILLADLVTRLDEWLGVKVDPSVPLERRTVAELSRYLVEDLPQALGAALAREGGSPSEPVAPSSAAPALPREALPVAEPAPAPLAAPRSARLRPEPAGDEPIAIIGLSCHFPGSPDVASFWRTLREGRDCITPVPPLRFRAEDWYAPVHQPGKIISRWGGFIDGIDLFDPAYFRIAEEDAPGIDPLMRQLLEVGEECFRHAGYAREDLAGRPVGVFIGSRMGSYASREQAFRRNSIIGSGQNFIAAHLSHFHDLRGPSLVVDTACSSSLVAVHQACRSLRAGESELALAGGVDILLDESVYLLLSESRALSPQGRCKTFDEEADGFVPGEGAGAVLLKPLRRALEDGDRVYAVIESSAVNNDGHTMGITTPSPAGQRAVIQSALRQAGIHPGTISCVEAHGTGTLIGDPIELKALTEVFSASSDRIGHCAVGSVKSNFGHLLSAAGIAGLLKVVLSLMHRELPPTLHCRTSNSRFRFAASPFFPNTALRPWVPLEGLRRAAVSAFGFGGTNAHAILTEAPLEHAPVRAPLPPPTFSRRRYWLERPEVPARAGPRTSGRRPLLALVAGTPP